jgi:hypothetical protein
MPKLPSTRAKRRDSTIGLSEQEVLTSSELILRLQNLGHTGESARQIIRRRAQAGDLWRSNKLRLPRGERLFADPVFHGKPEFFIAIGNKLQQTSRHGLARCISALGQSHVLHKIDVLRLLAVSPKTLPASGLAKSRVYRNELSGLAELGVMVIQEGTSLESLAAPTLPAEANADELAACAAERLRKAALIARVLAERLRRQNMLSWNRIEMPGPDAPYTTFNGQVFSAYGFSYLAPLTRWKEEKAGPTPCPVLIDCYHGRCTLPEVQSFKQRIDRATIRGRSKLQALGIIAASDFDREAWTDARKQGLLTVSLKQMFGDEALDAMVRVEQLLHGIDRDGDTESAHRFERFSELLKQLKSNPVVVELRSIGFEALAGLILSSNGYEQIEMGRVVPWTSTSRDVDVFGMRGDELRVVECKAYHRRRSVPGDEVRKFFTETLPALKQWLRQNNRAFERCTAEVWTTGPLGNEARDVLYELKRPKGDTWELKRMGDLQSLIPKPIRSRSITLLRSIATAETAEQGE